MGSEIYSYKTFGKMDLKRLMRTIAENYGVIENSMKMDQVTLVYDPDPKIVWAISKHQPIIIQFVMEYEHRVGWKVTDISEEVGILHVSCPMELILQTSGTESRYSTAWRQGVQEYWKRVSKAKQAYEKTVRDFIVDYGE